MDHDIMHVRARGERIPAMGFGTWQLEGEACTESVADALRQGYRHVDTAEAYGNEVEVGKGIRRSGVDRDRIWVTTKVWWKNLSYEECIESARASMDRLDLGPVDLLLVHWPAGEAPLEETLSALTRLKKDGAVRQIGVSNFTPTLLEKALKLAPILCNQVEYHPFLAQEELVRMAEVHDLMLTAYSPLARGRVTEDATLRRIGRRHGKSPAQVALRWLLQQPQVAVIPRAASPEHRRENLDLEDFELDDDEMELIAGLDEGLRLIDPEFGPDWER